MSIAAATTQERYQRLRRIRESLSEKGYRLTDQRILVLNAFLRNEDLKDKARDGYESRELKAIGVGEQSEHLSAEDIAIQLRREGQRVSRSTVYRMLAILEKLGLVRKLDFGDGQSRYEFIQGDEHHHHLICIKCGKAIDISGKIVESCADEVYSLANSLSKEFDFDVQTHRLEFWGICLECREKRDHCK